MKAHFKNLLCKTMPYQLYERHRARKKYWRSIPEDAKRRQFYSQLFRSGDLVFDIGANMGNRTRTFLEIGGRVIGFEPQQQCADFLESVLGNRGDFTLVRAALGAAPGEAEMFVSNAHTISTLSQQWVEVMKQGRFARYDWNARQKVMITTLDAAVEK